MQLDVLSDLHNATISAIENGQSFDTFKKNIKPTLQQKGWWGKQKMTDPLTGKEVNAQLGSDRRLKTIYRVNMRSAYQKGQYERTMESDLHPYLMYRIGPSVNHRQDHVSWNGLILPKTDPWWDSHFPPNGWGCKCYTRAVTEARLKKYQSEGIPNAGGGNIKPKTDAPPVNYKTYINERKGITEKVPEGVDPAFNWNVGKANRQEQVEEKLREARMRFDNLIKEKLDAGYAVVEGKLKDDYQDQTNQIFALATQKQKESMLEYTGTGFSEINDFLYGNPCFREPGQEELVRNLKTSIKHIDSLIKEFRLPDDIITFKGTEARFYKYWLKGETHTIPAYFSTSTEKNNEVVDGNDFLIELHITKKTRCIFLGERSNHPTESEFLLARKSKFFVLDKTAKKIIVEVTND